MAASRMSLFGFGVCVVLMAAFPASNAASIPLTWALGTTYAPLTASCGDTIAFSWSGGPPHGVVLGSAAACPSPFPKFTAGKVDTDASGNSYELLSASGASGTASYTFTTNGVFYFQCQVGSHCVSNMNQKVTVSGCTATAGAKAPSFSAKAPAPGPYNGPALAPSPLKALKARRSLMQE